MKKNEADLLLKLNKDFYDSIAFEFDISRSYSWSGWDVLVDKKYILGSDDEVAILDLGCGNGRFAEFLETRSISSRYVGVDSNRQLLNNAAKRLARSEKIKFTLIMVNILDQKAIIRQVRDRSRIHNFDLIVLFGVMHHIPSKNYRMSLLKMCAEFLKPAGTLVFSIWDFVSDDRFSSRMIDPSSIKYQGLKLEENDYILDWRKGNLAYRYCHFYPPNEIEDLLTDLNLEIIDKFNADGRSGKLNRYYVTRKS